MDDSSKVRLVLFLIGLIPVGMAVFGVWTGKAYLPTKKYAGLAPFVSRAKEPATFWKVVIFQFVQGVFFASLPFWRGH